MEKLNHIKELKDNTTIHDALCQIHLAQKIADIAYYHMLFKIRSKCVYRISENAAVSGNCSICNQTERKSRITNVIIFNRMMHSICYRASARNIHHVNFGENVNRKRCSHQTKATSKCWLGWNINEILQNVLSSGSQSIDSISDVIQLILVLGFAIQSNNVR